MKLLFIGPLQSSFVKNDIKILSEQHQLVFEDAAIGRGIKGLINLGLGTLRSIFRVLSSDGVFCWFADYTTLVPAVVGRLLGKKVFVIAGGFDVTYLPEINCGAWVRPMRRFCVSKTFSHATKIFPVSLYAENQLKRLTQGNHAPSTMIYNCIDSQKFVEAADYTSKRDIILTVSQADNRTEYIRKGSDLFINAAKENPKYKFVLAGLRGEALELAKVDAAGIANIDIVPGPLSLYEELIPYYNRAIAYCQFSIEETFGVAPLEAMICGALPIVSRGGALPEVAGDKGKVVSNFDDLSDVFHFANNMTEEQRGELKTHAIKFDISVRKKMLMAEVK